MTPVRWPPPPRESLALPSAEIDVEDDEVCIQQFTAHGFIDLQAALVIRGTLIVWSFAAWSFASRGRGQKALRAVHLMS